MQFVVLLIPYASIISKSKSKSTGETIVQLSYSWSSLVGMVRLSCFLYVKFGLMSVLQWCGKFSPVKLNLEADSAEKVCYSSSTFPLSTETWRVCPGCGCYRSAVRWIDLTAACMSHNSNNNKIKYYFDSKLFNLIATICILEQPLQSSTWASWI